MRTTRTGIIYQIWPRSFNDSNHDGIGDINGIISKLEYLVSLNVTYLWISPLYESPNYDYGYDVSDYYAINPEYGTMSDMERLISLAREKGITIIMDLVANHTSTQHPWFIEASTNPNSHKRDYYYFRKGKNNKEPNNWISIFGGSAWKQINNQEYALTLFTPYQADLNWDNPSVREEIAKIMVFWIQKGIGGFRLDVINTISKKEGLPDKNPHKKGYQFADDFIINRPKSLEYAKELMDKVKERTNNTFITIGEGMLINQAVAKQYSSQKEPIFDMMIHFDIALLGCGPLGKFDFRRGYIHTTKQLKKVISSWQHDMQSNNYWMANYLSSHDQPRQVSRLGNTKKHHSASAKALATLNFTLLGTPIMYQGEEIGMTNINMPREQWKDYEAINGYSVLQSMMHLPAIIAERIIKKMTRDNARTPMQWNNKQYAGFSSSEPWIVLNDNYKNINVDEQENNTESILMYYRKLTDLLVKTGINTLPHFIQILPKHPQIIGYRRSDDDASISYVVFINLSKKMATFKLPKTTEHSIILHNYETPPHLSKKMILRPYEAIVLEKEDTNES